MPLPKSPENDIARTIREKRQLMPAAMSNATSQSAGCVIVARPKANYARPRFRQAEHNGKLRNGTLVLTHFERI
jgi:hypothetical protein